MGRLRFKKILKEFGKIVSLDSAYRRYIFLIVLIALAVIPLPILEKTPQLSICYKELGDNCPSTGITRGVSSLLKGDFALAQEYNKLSVLVLIVMITIIIADFCKKARTQKYK